MSRSTSIFSVLAALAFGLSVPTAAEAAQSTAPATTCQRTLAHYPVLHPGDRSRAVRTLQCVLNDDGYGPVVVSGWYGPQTRAAVNRVEGGFEGTAPHPGRINNGFWVLLFGQHLPDRDLRRGQHGPAVRTLQRALRAAGGSLVVDGSFGPRTRGVVQAYQRAQGLPATGVANDNTRFFLAMGAALGDQD